MPAIREPVVQSGLGRRMVGVPAAAAFFSMNNLYYSVSDIGMFVCMFSGDSFIISYGKVCTPAASYPCITRTVNSSEI